MGERGQILIKNSGIYLYTHWTGDSLKQILASALSKKWRWDDEEYLTRIIFCEMVKDDVGSETGYGIGTEEHGDNNYPMVVVDVKNQTITEEKKSWTFDNFIVENVAKEL